MARRRAGGVAGVTAVASRGLLSADGLALGLSIGEEGAGGKENHAPLAAFFASARKPRHSSALLSGVLPSLSVAEDTLSQSPRESGALEPGGLTRGVEAAAAASDVIGGTAHALSPVRPPRSIRDEAETLPPQPSPDETGALGEKGLAADSKLTQPSEQDAALAAPHRQPSRDEADVLDEIRLAVSSPLSLPQEEAATGTAILLQPSHGEAGACDQAHLRSDSLLTAPTSATAASPTLPPNGLAPTSPRPLPANAGKLVESNCITVSSPAAAVSSIATPPAPLPIVQCGAAIAVQPSKPLSIQMGGPPEVRQIIDSALTLTAAEPPPPPLSPGTLASEAADTAQSKPRRRRRSSVVHAHLPRRQSRRQSGLPPLIDFQAEMAHLSPVLLAEEHVFVSNACDDNMMPRVNNLPSPRPSLSPLRAVGGGVTISSPTPVEPGKQAGRPNGDGATRHAYVQPPLPEAELSDPLQAYGRSKRIRRPSARAAASFEQITSRNARSSPLSETLVAASCAIAKPRGASRRRSSGQPVATVQMANGTTGEGGLMARVLARSTAVRASGAAETGHAKAFGAPTPLEALSECKANSPTMMATSPPPMHVAPEVLSAFDVLSPSHFEFDASGPDEATTDGLEDGCCLETTHHADCKSLAMSSGDEAKRQAPPPPDEAPPPPPDEQASSPMAPSTAMQTIQFTALGGSVHCAKRGRRSSLGAGRPARPPALLCPSPSDSVLPPILDRSCNSPFVVPPHPPLPSPPREPLEPSVRRTPPSRKRRSGIHSPLPTHHVPSATTTPTWPNPPNGEGVLQSSSTALRGGQTGTEQEPPLLASSQQSLRTFLDALGDMPLTAASPVGGVARCVSMKSPARGKSPLLASIEPSGDFKSLTCTPFDQASAASNGPLGTDGHAWHHSCRLGTSSKRTNVAPATSGLLTSDGSSAFAATSNAVSLGLLHVFAVDGAPTTDIGDGCGFSVPETCSTMKPSDERLAHASETQADHSFLASPMRPVDVDTYGPASALLHRALRICDAESRAPVVANSMSESFSMGSFGHGGGSASASWASLRPCVAHLAEVQAWLHVQACSSGDPPAQPVAHLHRAATSPATSSAPDAPADRNLSDEAPRRRRRVVFAPHDGSHLAPSRWGDGDPTEIAALGDAVVRADNYAIPSPRGLSTSLERIYDAVLPQLQWYERAAAVTDGRVGESIEPSSDVGGAGGGDPQHLATLDCLRRAIATAAAEALALPTTTATSAGPHSSKAARATADFRSRIRATAAFLDEQIRGLAGGIPVLGARLSELLRSLLRQQLRLLFEDDTRNDALLATVPRGRSIGYLCPEANSAAKVIALALYDYDAHKGLATHPAMVTLVTGQKRGSASKLVQGEREALLGFAEAHAALHHILTHPLVTDILPQQWAPLRSLLARAKASHCEEEALYFPLADIAAFESELRASAYIAAAIRAALSGKSS